MEEKIKIAVLCLDVLDVDIITVDKSFIDENFGGDIEAECKSVIDGFVKEEKQARLNYLRQKIRKKGLQLRLPFLDYPQIKVSI